jgi:hypothetical protein
MKYEVKCSYCDNIIFRYKTKTNNYFCNIECKSNWQILQRENKGFNKEFLIKEYVNNCKSADQIAREIHRDPKRVWEWLTNYGIKTRPRGTDYGQNFKKGHKLGIGRQQKEETKEKIRQSCIRDGRVPYLKNGIHWLKYYDKKPASWKGGISPDRNAFYSSLEWIEVVKKVWQRDNAICNVCGKNHNDKFRGTFHIHHIISFKNKLTRANLDNLILVCDKCHRWLHSKKNIDKKFIKEV